MSAVNRPESTRDSWKVTVPGPFDDLWVGYAEKLHLLLIPLVETVGEESSEDGLLASRIGYRPWNGAPIFLRDNHANS